MVYTQKWKDVTNVCNPLHSLIIHLTGCRKYGREPLRIDKIENLCYNREMAYTPKPYTLLETREDGTEIRLYEDGSQRDQNGRVLVANERFKETQITAENSRQLHALRKKKILDAIEAELQAKTRTNVPEKAIAAIVGKRAEIAMKDDGRTGNEAAKIVLSAVDAYQDKQPQDRTNVLRHEYAMDEETRQLLEDMLRQRRDSTDAIEAEEIE